MRRLFDQHFVEAVRLMLETPNVGFEKALAMQSAMEARGNRRPAPTPHKSCRRPSPAPSWPSSAPSSGAMMVLTR